MATIATSSVASTAGTAHDGPRLNLGGSSSGTAIAKTNVKAIGQRFSAPALAIPGPDTGLPGGLPRLSHQSRTLASTFTAAGDRSAAASASAIKARAASIVAATSPWSLVTGTFTTIQARS